MFSGPEKKVAYPADKFRRALTSCGPTATIQVGAIAKPTLFEAEDYWHILAPNTNFPKEITLTNSQRDAIQLMQESLEAIRKGEAPGLVLIGNGKFYLELVPGLTQTEVLVREPKLADAAAAVDQPETRRTRELEDRNK
jgi:hypothetical protein